MANRIYAVTFHVAEANLGTVVSTMVGSATLVSVVPTKPASSTDSSASSAPSSKTRNNHYANGIRNKGISGEQLLLKTLGEAERPMSLGEIVNAFVNHGFAGNSANPVLSIMTRTGKVRALGGGRFCLPGTTVHI